MFENIFKNLKNKKPLIHNITNYVTVNDCANIILAVGGSPIMADDINEVEEITSICNALVINIGTLNEKTIQSMMKAGKKSNQFNHPVILDPVGVGASALRTQTAYKLLQQIKFSVIRGNISEIKAVNDGVSSTRGVDADKKDAISENTLDEAIILGRDLSNKTGAVVVITGEMDIVTDGKKTYIIKNGHPAMSQISGTGCMLSAMIATYCAANEENVLDASACAVASMGLSGELAYNKMKENNLGTASLRTFIIDYNSNMCIETLNGGVKIEIR